LDRQRSTNAGVLGENPDARAGTRRAVYAFAAAALPLDPNTIPCRLCALPSGWHGAIASQTGPETENEPEYPSLARRSRNPPYAVAAVVAGTATTAQHANATEFVGNAIPSLTRDGQPAASCVRVATGSENACLSGTTESNNCLTGVRLALLLDPEHCVPVDISDESCGGGRRISKFPKD
jgi:hypothetical protein